MISQATQDSHRLDGKVPFSLRVWAESTGVKSGKAQSSRCLRLQVRKSEPESTVWVGEGRDK